MAVRQVAKYGKATVVVPAGQKIVVQSLDVVKVYKQAGYPNAPTKNVLDFTSAAGSETVSSAYASGATLIVEAAGAPVFYDTGASPAVSQPQADLSAADATFTIQGLGAAQGGYTKIVGGTSSTSGNAGGEAGVLGGQPGATGVGGAATVTGGAGGATSGAGGQAVITGGAGTNGNANGGSVILTGGAANGSGVAGMIIERSVKLVKQGAPTAKTTSATLTAAEILAGIITVAQGAGASSAQQLPLATAMDTAMPDAAAGDAFDFSVINTSTVDAEDASITTNTGWTLVGAMEVPAYSTSANSSLNSSARFRARKTGTGAWTLYRLS